MFEHAKSDVETHYEEAIAPMETLGPQPVKELSLGKRGLTWKIQFIKALNYRLTIANLRMQGYTKEEIADQVPEYYYDEEYHELIKEPWFRRTKSTADIKSCIGTNQGYSGWEFVGTDRPQLWNRVTAIPSMNRLSLEGFIS